MGSMASAVCDPGTQAIDSEQAEDEYDPRNPVYIMPASKQQIEEINIAVLEKQIHRLQGAISHRLHDDEHILEHYQSVLLSLQRSLQAALHRREQEDASANSGSLSPVCSRSLLIPSPTLTSPQVPAWPGGPCSKLGSCAGPEQSGTSCMQCPFQETDKSRFLALGERSLGGG